MRIVLNLVVMAVVYCLGYFSSRFFTKRWIEKNMMKSTNENK